MKTKVQEPEPAEPQFRRWPVVEFLLVPLFFLGACYFLVSQLAQKTEFFESCAPRVPFAVEKVYLAQDQLNFLPAILRPMESLRPPGRGDNILPSCQRGSQLWVRINQGDYEVFALPHFWDFNWRFNWLSGGFLWFVGVVVFLLMGLFGLAQPLLEFLEVRLGGRLAPRPNPAYSFVLSTTIIILAAGLVSLYFNQTVAGQEKLTLLGYYFLTRTSVNVFLGGLVGTVIPVLRRGLPIRSDQRQSEREDLFASVFPNFLLGAGLLAVYGLINTFLEIL